jgi:hypothetical protein
MVVVVVPTVAGFFSFVSKNDVPNFRLSLTREMRTAILLQSCKANTLSFMRDSFQSMMQTRTKLTLGTPTTRIRSSSMAVPHPRTPLISPCWVVILILIALYICRSEGFQLYPPCKSNHHHDASLLLFGRSSSRAAAARRGTAQQRTTARRTAVPKPSSSSSSFSRSSLTITEEPETPRDDETSIITNVASSSSSNDGTTTTTTKQTKSQAKFRPNHHRHHDDDKDENESLLYDVSDTSIRSFNMDLYNLAMDDPFAAEDAIDYLLERPLPKRTTNGTNDDDNNINNNWLVPNPASFGIVLEGFLHQNELVGAEAFLFRDHKIHNDESGPNNNDAATAAKTVTLHDCLRLMQAWKDHEIAGDFCGHGAEQAERIRRRYHQQQQHHRNVDEEEEDHDDDEEEEEEKLLCVAIEAWCRRAGTCLFALDRAEQLLAEMEQRRRHVRSSGGGNNNTSSSRTDTSRLYAYTSYMVGLSKMTSRPDMATTAQDIYDTKLAQPDIVAVTAVLNCWAKTRNVHERSRAAVQAVAILDDLDRRNPYLEANVVTYRTAIAAIGNSIEPADLALAEAIIHERMPRQGLEPDTKTYNAWLLYGVREAQRAVEILETMPCEPDVETWGAVLRLCDPEQGQALLHQMEWSYEKGTSKVRPNCVCYTTVRQLYVLFYRHSHRPSMA